MHPSRYEQQPSDGSDGESDQDDGSVSSHSEWMRESLLRGLEFDDDDDDYNRHDVVGYETDGDDDSEIQHVGDAQFVDRMYI